MAKCSECRYFQKRKLSDIEWEGVGVCYAKPPVIIGIKNEKWERPEVWEANLACTYYRGTKNYE